MEKGRPQLKPSEILESARLEGEINALKGYINTRNQGIFNDWLNGLRSFVAAAEQGDPAARQFLRAVKDSLADVDRVSSGIAIAGTLPRTPQA